MTVAGAAVDVRGVSRLFRLGSEDVWAVRDVTMTIAPGEFLALVGRSGSGKTTLLNLIGGLDSPTEGAIEIDGRGLHALSEKELTGIRRRDLGFVFQSFGLLPLLSAQENVELPLRIAGFPHGERLRRAREALDRVGLARRLSHRPYELSGGEQQRVAIARAVAIQPRLILADEPTGELDSATARVILALLRDLARETGATVVACTHDRLVMDVADRVEQLADGRLLSRLDDEPVAPLHSAPAVGAPVSGFEAASSERPATALPTAESPPADDVARWARPGSRHD